MLDRYHILDVVKVNKDKHTIVMCLVTKGIHGYVGAVCLHCCDGLHVQTT